MSTQEQRKLISTLQRLGLISTIPSEATLNSRSNAPIKLLAHLGLLNEQEAIKAVATDLGIQRINLDAGDVQEKITFEKFSENIDAKKCWEKKAIPLWIEGSKVIVAMANPYDYDSLKAFEFALDCSAEPVIAEEVKISRMLKELLPSSSLQFDQLDSVEGSSDIEILNSSLMDQDLDVEDAQSPPVVRLCNRIISDAIREDASDIHIEPGQYGFDVRYRIDGVMHTALEVPRRLQPYVLSRLKLIAGMDIAERRRPQDGRLRVRVDKEFVDMRVSSVPTSFGEKIVLRILRNNVSDLTFASLGLQPDTEQRILNTLNQRGRMLLVTGPTGSGKTTMLYTCLSYLRDGTTNIETVEDPIEYRVSGVNQIQVNESAGVTFASALRSILRQDPDVIMIGEIRDSETAEIALQAAQTGHMVLSTLHTNDAPSTITRMLSLEVEPYQLSTSLSGVLAQRLVRKLCDSCKEPLSLHKPEKYTDFLDQLELSADDIYTSIGCEVCRFRGYQGRTGVYSYLEITDPIAELISSGAGTNAIVEQALTSGFRHLSDNATDLVRSGVTSFEEIRGLLRLTVAQTDTAATTVVAVAPQEHSTPLAQAAANVVESPDPAAALQKPKILLVEDDEDIRSILTMMLEREMFEVIQAHNGQDGLTKLYEHSPTLVLCDLMMPVMDGREFIKRMQDNDQTRKIPIVVLTAIDEEKNEIELLDIGATDFVSKATNSNVLLTRIRRALRQAT